MPIGAVILAAGKGSRMGLPKWQLKMPDGDYFYTSLVEKFKEFGCETVLVINEQDYIKLAPQLNSQNISYAVNSRLDLGRSYSLQCGLKKLSSVDFCFVHNIDNPYLSSDLLKALTARIGNFDYALPEYNKKGGHPLLINSKIINRILSVENSFTDFREVLAEFNGIRVPFNQPEILLNINTPEDYEKFMIRTYS
jgi:molybdenum cofactor cytidylyltransferase